MKRIVVSLSGMPFYPAGQRIILQSKKGETGTVVALESPYPCKRVVKI